MIEDLDSATQKMRSAGGPDAKLWTRHLCLLQTSGTAVRVAGGSFFVDRVEREFRQVVERAVLALDPSAARLKFVRAAVSAPASSPLPTPPVALATDEDDLPRRRIVAPTMAEFETMPIPPREFLLAPWLPRQGLAMIYGPRGGGKTWLAWSIAMAVASGSELFGKWAAPRPGRVLYVDGELPAGVIRDRMMTAKRGRTGGELAGDAIRIIAADMQPEGLRSLDSAEGQRDLDAHLEGADLVVFDNLSALTRCRENEADDWGPFQGYLLSLRRRGLSALLVHHAGKGGQQRGTSRREDVLDSVLALRKPQDHDPRAGAAFELHFEKARGFWGDDAAPFGLRFDVGGDGGACWTITDVDAADAQRSRAREMRASGSSVRDIAAATGAGKSTVHRWLAG